MATPRYQVILHALAPDATDAGTQYADTTLDGVSEAQLRTLLDDFADLAGRLAPLDTFRPHIRINFPAGLAMITPLDGKLYYGSWDTKGRGIEASVDDIMAMVMGTAEVPKPAPGEIRSSAPPMRKAATGRRKYLTIAALGIAIVAMNCATAWMLLKPARTILPPHVFLSDAQSDALMKQVAGEYQTGPLEGDRHLEISALGLFRFAVYGPHRTLTRVHLQSGRAARITGGTVILTNEYGVLRIIDPNTITIYGDTYRRIFVDRGG